jgi:Hypothetical glycosyl hydrolase family 15
MGTTVTKMGRIAGRAIPLVLLCVTALSCIATRSSSPDAQDASADLVMLWAPPYLPAGHVTIAEAVARARRFRVIAAHPWTYRGDVQAMRQAAPDLVLLAYVNGTLAQRSQGDTYPRTWYLRDAARRKVRSLDWGNYLMDPRDPGWIADRVDRCRHLIQETGFDGCLVDMLGTAPIHEGYVTAAPIDPETGSPWTPDAWLAATASLGAAVRQGNPGASVIGNGLGNGARFVDREAPSEQILTGLDGGIAEAWLRTAREPVDRYPDVQAWRSSVDMLQATDKTVFVEVKVWTRSTKQQTAAWRLFALASFLLGNGGTSYLAFSGARAETGVAPDVLKVGSRLGAPIGSYEERDGVYQRSFADGSVVVNPSDRTSTIDLGADYRDEGGTVVRSLTLGPHSAAILTTA